MVGQPFTDRRPVLVFVKTPEEGFVKTRLARRVGNRTAVRLYRCFTEDVLDTVDGTGRSAVVFHHPAEDREPIRRWLGPGRQYRRQTGLHLGERMRNAFLETFSDGCRAAVLIGTDFPDLPGSILQEAFRALHNCGAVVGPVTDGGYYLIGFEAGAFNGSVFENASWGTPDVFRRTLAIFRRKHIAVHLLPMWRDIDEYDDLAYFVANCPADPQAGRRTAAYLASIGMMKSL